MRRYPQQKTPGKFAEWWSLSSLVGLQDIRAEMQPVLGFEFTRTRSPVDVEVVGVSLLTREDVSRAPHSRCSFPSGNVEHVDFCLTHDFHNPTRWQETDPVAWGEISRGMDEDVTTCRDEQMRLARAEPWHAVRFIVIYETRITSIQDTRITSIDIISLSDSESEREGEKKGGEHDASFLGWRVSMQQKVAFVKV